MATNGVSNGLSSMKQYDPESLGRIDTSGSVVTLPADIYEKLYLTPQTAVSGKLRKTFGNPTPLAVAGFLLAATPLGFILMGWRGATGGGQAIIGSVYFFGGVLQLFGCVMEWIIGNTFPCVVFGTFGAFWLALGITLTPQYHAIEYFIADATTEEEIAAGLAQFYAGFAFFLLMLGILVFVYLICSICTNVVFMIVFLFLTVAVELLAAAYFYLALGDEAMGETLELAAGACACVFNAAGWYLLVAQLFQSVRFPFDLPVGDLSSRIAKKES